MASKQKLVEGNCVYVKNRRSSGLWEVYAVRKFGRKTRYSIRRMNTEGTTLMCNVEGKKLEKVEKE